MLRSYFAQMKRFFTLLLAAFCLTAVGQSLPMGIATKADFSKGEDAAWTNFCNEALDLSVAEQAEFWTGYHQMEADMAALKKKKRSREMSLLNPFMTSNKAVVQVIEDIAEVKVAMVDIEQDFMLSLVKLLGPKRAIKFNLAKREYKHQLKEHRRQQD